MRGAAMTDDTLSAEPAAVNALRDAIPQPCDESARPRRGCPVQGRDARSGVARGAPALRRAQTPPPARRGVGGARLVRVQRTAAD